MGEDGDEEWGERMEEPCEQEGDGGEKVVVWRRGSVV